MGQKVQDPAARIRDVGGVERQPLSVGSSKVAVLFFVSHDCPVSNSYAPEIQRICSTYGDKVAFSIVHPFEDLSDAQAKKHAADYGWTSPILVDRERAVTRQVGARKTPEAAIVGADGTLLYRGRIDNLWTNFGSRRAEATEHELRVAIDAALAGKPVPQPTGEAVGCPIEP